MLSSGPTPILAAIDLDWFFANKAWVFGVPALVGSALFAIKLVLMLAGFHHVHAGGDLHDFGHDFDANHGGWDLTATLKRLSIQGIIIFLAAFGWAGLTLYRTAHWKLWASVVLACAVGLALMWTFNLLMTSMLRLQTSGTIDISEAVGCPGEVYVGIPGYETGRGQVQIVVNQRLRTYNAQSKGEALERSRKVVVVDIGADNTLIVAPA